MKKIHIAGVVLATVVVAFAVFRQFLPANPPIDPPAYSEPRPATPPSNSRADEPPYPTVPSTSSEDPHRHVPQPPASAPAWSRGHVYAGFPRYARPLKVLENQGYVVGYCDTRKNPLWVAYRAFDVDNPLRHKRPSRFRVDRRTRAQVSHDDYTRSGYDRGHMAPNYVINTRYGQQAQYETFLMSNIVPQKPNLNRHVWVALEMLVAKDYTARFEEVWVICGPVFDGSIETLASGVEIPDAFYKIIVDEKQRAVRVLAFMVPQGVERQDQEPLVRFLTSIREVERRTGLDFLHELPDDIEGELEQKKAESLW